MHDWYRYRCVVDMELDESHTAVVGEVAGIVALVVAIGSYLVQRLEEGQTKRYVEWKVETFRGVLRLSSLVLEQLAVVVLELVEALIL